jgi:hypothetical protein
MPIFSSPRFVCFDAALIRHATLLLPIDKDATPTPLFRDSFRRLAAISCRCLPPAERHFIFRHYAISGIFTLFSSRRHYAFRRLMPSILRRRRQIRRFAADARH